MSLTGLAELTIKQTIEVTSPAVLPAALGQLQGLRKLEFHALGPSASEVGCLNLPRLQSLRFLYCDIKDAGVLSRVTALQNLTSIEFLGCPGLPFIAQLVELPCLQRLVFTADMQYEEDSDLEADDLHNGLTQSQARLPLDMGYLCTGLLHLDFSQHQLVHFPLALTQLLALEYLDLEGNEFVELPAGITALSRLTKVGLGRVMRVEDPMQLHGKCPLDVSALGDLHSFPALRELSFSLCEVNLCGSFLDGALSHARFARLSFDIAHPAPKCALMVLQLSQYSRMRTKGRRSVVRCKEEQMIAQMPDEMRDAQG